MTIGLEYLTGGQVERSADTLRKNYVQAIFKVGFGQIAKLRSQADVLAGIPRFQIEMLDPPDREFVEALRRFKPLIIEDGRYRRFRSMADIDAVQKRIQALTVMVRAFLPQFPGMPTTFARAFNTATVRAALYGRFEVVPLGADELRDLEAWLSKGFHLPDIGVPPEFAPFAEKWWAELRAELEPLSGKKIDARFMQAILVKL